MFYLKQKIFGDTTILREIHADNVYTRCPCCGETEPDLEDAYECEHCGGVYHAYKFSEIDGMCQKCFDDSVNKLKKYVEAHGDETDNKVLSFLLDF